MSRFTLAVVIPAYNAAAFITEAPDSVARQALAPTEIIVVDDISTDATAATVRRWAETYAPALQLITQMNGGTAAARYRGSRAATSDFIALLDADDVMHSNHLATFASLFEQAPDAVLCFADAIRERNGKPDPEGFLAGNALLDLAFVESAGGGRVRQKNNRGLARTFRTGVDACLSLGADIIVNTDGDNQYAGKDLCKLVAPIVRGEADIVVGDRQTMKIAHFSKGKKMLQKLGSGVVRFLPETNVPDTVSGFRAISRDAALQLTIVSPFSYTIEMAIQVGKKHLAVTSVPIETNPKTRESRLFKSTPKFIQSQLSTIVRMYSMDQPLRVFFYLGLTLSVIGSIPILRFLGFYFVGDGAGHLQSLVLGWVLLTMGFITFMIGRVADIISFNCQLIEMALKRVRRMQLQMETDEKDGIGE